jgi:hypothetical protein
MKYLVEYGFSRQGQIVEANSEEEAVKVALDEAYLTAHDFEYRVYVFEIPDGHVFEIDRNLTVTPVHK